MKKLTRREFLFKYIFPSFLAALSFKVLHFSNFFNKKNIEGNNLANKKAKFYKKLAG